MFSYKIPGICYLSHVMRKPAFCMCQNKGADQLRSTGAADQHLCFRYKDSTIPLLSKPEMSSLYPSSMVVQPDLCWTRLQPEDRFSYDIAHFMFVVQTSCIFSWYLKLNASFIVTHSGPEVVKHNVHSVRQQN